MTEPAAPQKAVNLVDESTGQVVNVNESDLGSLGAGYRMATPEEVQADLDRQQYGEGFGNELAAGAEGALSGATLGLSDVAAKYIAPDYAEGLAKRREYNPNAAAIGEGAGILGATLLTGGLEGAAAGGLSASRVGLGAARTLGAPARALTGLGEAVTGGAAKLLGTEAATGLLGKAAREGIAAGLGGGTEGALFGAAKVATDDFLNDHEITAERILAGAENGALSGAALGGTLGAGTALVQETASKVWPQLKRALDAETVDDFVGERAYKAALGGRNLRDVQRSERIGGPAEVGKTLLREGVVTPTSTIDDIAQAAKARADDYGSRIGQIVDELDGLDHAAGVRSYPVDEAAVAKELDRLNGDMWTTKDVTHDGYELRNIPLSEVEARPVWQEAKMPRIRKGLEEGAPLPPIRADRGADGLYAIDDGIHRVNAAREAGLTHVPAIVPKSAAKSAMAGPDGRALMRRIEEEVLAPMRAKAAQKDIAQAIENKPLFKNLSEALTREDAPPLKFRDLWELRRDFDDRLKFEQPPAPFVAPSPELEGLRKIRRVFEEYWQEAGDAAAKAAGKDSLMAEFRDAKRSYSQLRHASEIAEKAIARDSANRMLSPSDYGFGAVVAGADALAGGGAGLGSLAYGLASGAVHKFFRERGSALFAGTMYQLRGAPKLVRDARAGEQAVEGAARGFVSRLVDKAKYAARRAPNAVVASAARALSSPEAYERAARTAAELANPESPRRQDMKRQAAMVRVHYPALANALDAKAQSVGTFIAAKAGPLSATPKAGDPFAHVRKPRHDPAKAQRLARYVDAAANPRGVLERVGKGEVTREDMEVLQALYPRMYQRVRDEVLMNLSKVDELPSYEARLKLGHLLNAPTDPSMRPEVVQALQQVARSGLGAKAAQEERQMGAGGEPVLSPSQRKAPESAKIFATQTDAQSVMGSRLGG